MSPSRAAAPRHRLLGSQPRGLLLVTIGQQRRLFAHPAIRLASGSRGPRSLTHARFWGCPVFLVIRGCTFPGRSMSIFHPSGRTGLRRGPGYGAQLSATATEVRSPSGHRRRERRFKLVRRRRSNFRDRLDNSPAGAKLPPRPRSRLGRHSQYRTRVFLRSSGLRSYAGPSVGLRRPMCCCTPGLRQLPRGHPKGS